MLKLIGIVLILLSSATVGLTLTSRLKRRVRLLQSISDTLRCVRREISYGMPPLADILSRCAFGELACFTGAVSTALTHGERLEEAVYKAAAGESLRLLTKVEREELVRVFSSLGTTDSATQTELIDAALSRNEEFISSAAQQCAANSKVYLTLSVYIGLTAAIVLI